MALFASAFFRLKCPYIRGFWWFVSPQNSRISRNSSRCPEYARNEEFSKNTLAVIRHSLSLRFGFLHLDSKIRTNNASDIQFKNVNTCQYGNIQSLIFKYAKAKLLIQQLISINIRSQFLIINNLELSQLCYIVPKQFNLSIYLAPSGIAYRPVLNMYTVNTLFITSCLHIMASIKTL